MSDCPDGIRKSYQANSGYVVRQVIDEYLLIPVKMQEQGDTQLAIMNETGKFLWEQMQGGCSVQDLLKAMTEEYQISENEALADILDFISDLKERKLLLESRGGTI